MHSNQASAASSESSVRIPVDVRRFPWIRRLAADYAYDFPAVAPFFSGDPADESSRHIHRFLFPFLIIWRAIPKMRRRFDVGPVVGASRLRVGRYTVESETSNVMRSRTLPLPSYMRTRMATLPHTSSMAQMSEMLTSEIDLSDPSMC